MSMGEEQQQACDSEPYPTDRLAPSLAGFMAERAIARPGLKVRIKKRIMTIAAEREKLEKLLSLLDENPQISEFMDLIAGANI